MNFKLFLEGSAVALPQLVSNYLTGKIDQGTFSSQIRDAFTVRKDMYDLWNKSKATPEFAQWKKWYEDSRNYLEKFMQQSGWKPSENPGWLQFESPNKQSNKIDNKTFKRYYTIELNDAVKFIQNIPSLAKLLSQVKTDNSLSFKIPNSYGGLMTERDTLVIHFYDRQADQQIAQSVNTFFQQINLKPTDRASKFNNSAPDSGVDVNKNSDTVMLAQRFQRNIDGNKQVLTNMLKTNPNQFGQQLQAIWNQLNQEGLHRK